MKQRLRIYYTEAQKALIWNCWKAGDTVHEIGKLFDPPHTSIHTILSATGGIRPPARHRSRLELTMSEREKRSPEHWLLANRFAASPKTLICLHTQRTAWTPLPESSINDQAKLWDIEHLLKCSMNVLRRSVETTARSGKPSGSL